MQLAAVETFATHHSTQGKLNAWADHVQAPDEDDESLSEEELSLPLLLESLSDEEEEDGSSPPFFFFFPLSFCACFVTLAAASAPLLSGSSSPAPRNRGRYCSTTTEHQGQLRRLQARQLLLLQGT